jgi:hypothetical protein
MSKKGTPTIDANCLDMHLPPLKTTGVAPNVVSSLTKFVATQERTGISLVETIAKKQEFSNPAILQQVIGHYGLNEKGTNLSIAVQNENANIG